MKQKLSRKEEELYWRIIENEGLGVGELAQKTNVSEPTMSLRLRVLENLKWVWYELDDRGERGIRKRYYPSLRWLFEPIALSKRVKFDDDTYKHLDKFIFYKNFTKFWKDMKNEPMDTATKTFMIVQSIINKDNLEKITKMIDNDPELKEHHDKGVLPYYNKVQLNVPYFKL